MRKGDQIGQHLSTFSVAGDALTVHSEAEVTVRMIGVAVFRYRNSMVEHWQGGRFMALDSKTDDDGTHYWAQVARNDAGLAVTGSSIKPYVAPAEALPMTHWNRAELNVPKLNPQKGDLLRPVVTDRGVMPVATAAGPPVEARHWTFSGQATLDVWYDLDGHWASLAFLGGDQSQITLERQ